MLEKQYPQYDIINFISKFEEFLDPNEMMLSFIRRRTMGMV